jgi:hypothetical protein
METEKLQKELATLRQKREFNQKELALAKRQQAAGVGGELEGATPLNTPRW